MSTPHNWIWPSNDEINDFPDPLGFEAEWKDWVGTMADPSSSKLAEIFVRELVQNSWDSIQECTKGIDADRTADRGLTFREIRLTGDAAGDFVSKFGLREHEERFSRMSDRHRQDSRLTDSAVVQGDVAELRLLVVSERWGVGMWGPWKTGGKPGIVSLLKSALIQTKSEKQNVASGGSWGHGKKGIANASNCRTLAVYTASAPHDVDHTDGTLITRRFLGVSYWRSHDIPDESSHVGLGLLGVAPAPNSYNEFSTLENQAADDFVAGLAVPGFEPRNPEVPGETGVTYLIVEPSFSVEQLASAVARNWWPLLLAHSTAIRVLDHEGIELESGPASLPELEPFIQAHRLAVQDVDPAGRGEVSKAFSDVIFGPVGRLGLTSDVREDGWSFLDPEKNESLVALVRNEMVIAYQKFPLAGHGKPPFVRGVFFVDRVLNEKASEGLKMAEPHLHNEWTRDPSPSVPKVYADFARRTLSKVSSAVSDLKESLRKDQNEERHHFDEFSRIWGAGQAVTKGGGDGKPKPVKRPREHSIQFVEETIEAHPSDPTQLRVRWTVRIALLPRVAAKSGSLKSVVDLGWGVLEERGAVRDSSLTDASSVSAPDDFALEDGLYRGVISSEPVEFTWQSQYFSDDWQVVPDPRVESAPPAAAGTDAGESEEERNEH